jgi:hypothetical protein
LDYIAQGTLLTLNTEVTAVEEIVTLLWEMEVLSNQTLTLIDHLEWGFKFRQASLEECITDK